MADFSVIEGDVTVRSGGTELAAADGAAFIAGTRGWISLGFDGTSTRFFLVDSQGHQIAVGAGVAGTPAGGVMTVQGAAGGVAFPVSAASLPLPTGAATQATLASMVTEATFISRVNTQGQKTMAASTPVVIASDQSAIPLSATQGTAASAGAPWAMRLSDGSAFYSTPTAAQLPTALVGSRLDVNSGAWLGSTAPSVGQKTMASSIPVVIASDMTGTSAVQVQGNSASGAAPSGNPQMGAVYDGTNTQRSRGFTDGTTQVREREDATFMVIAAAVVPGNNKSMLSMFNAHATRKVRVHAIYLVNTQNTNVTGVIATFELRRLTGSAPSGGTDLTTTGVEQVDTADAKDASWSVATGATVGTEATKLLWRVDWSNDEWISNTADQESADHQMQTMAPMWGKQNCTTKPIVLRTNEGAHVKCATNTTIGAFDVFAVVSEEA